MSSSSASSCQVNYGNQVGTFNLVVAASLFLTLVRTVFWKSRVASQQRELARYSIAAGLFKIALGISLYTVFWPTCPEMCHCESFDNIYPIVAIMIGTFWVYQGIAAAATQDATTATADEGVGDGVVFATIPTEEDEVEIVKQKLPLAVVVSSPA